MKVVDLTFPIYNNMPVYPGDPAPRVEQVAFLEKDGWNEHSLSLQMHVGTHIDAPYHFIEGGKRIDEIPPSTFFGRAVVADCPRTGDITQSHFKDCGAREGDILVLRTGFINDIKEKGIVEGAPQPHVTEEAAQWAVDAGVKMLGIDAHGPGDEDSGFSTHKLLLGNGVLLIEWLNNLELVPSEFQLYAFPLKITGAEAAPARALAIVE